MLRCINQKMKVTLCTGVILSLTGCGTAMQVRVADPEKQALPPGPTTVFIASPDVQQTLLAVGGVPEPRADWTQATATNLLAATQSWLADNGHEGIEVDLSDHMHGRAGQVVRLHEAVGASIMRYSIGNAALPSKPSFDWSVGDGAAQLKTLASDKDADYGLFIVARATYETGGRILAGIIMAAATGASTYDGGSSRYVFASLVDLNSGQIVWFNSASTNSDMREPDGARDIMATVLATSPFGTKE